MITELKEQHKHENVKLSTGQKSGGPTHTEVGGLLPSQHAGQKVATTFPPMGWTDTELDTLTEEWEVFGEPEHTTQAGAVPRLVTRGPLPEGQVAPLSNKQTKIDTLSFTAKEPYWIIQELVELSCIGVSFARLKTGKNGYHSGFSVIQDNREIAQIFYGSLINDRQNEKPQLQIGGNGKTDLFNWVKFHHYASMLDSPTVTRVDICHDIFDGSITIEQVIQAHLELKFKRLNAPKNPRITPYGQIQPDGTNPGRTIYIGSLKSAMSARCYEKGPEQFKNILASELGKNQFERDIIEQAMVNGTPMIVDGHNDNKPIDLLKWLRSEVQFRNTNCDINLDILINHDQYFSGAYPFFKEVLNMSEGKTNPRFKTPDEINLLVRIANMKAIAGSLIDDLQILGWNETEIIEALKGGKGASQKLLRSGAFKEC